MEIKKKLKTYDVKLTKLASDMNISRPTLDYYINCYEKGIAIPNEKYQKVFDLLFENSVESTVDFAIRYDRIKKMVDQNQEKNLIETTSQRRMYISEKITSSIYRNQMDISLLEFLNLFIENSNNDLVKAIYLYFNYTNGFLSVTDALSLQDKALYSQLIRVFSQYNDKTIEHDELQFDKFMEKNMKMVEKNNFNQSIDSILDQIKAQVKNNPEIDYDQIKTLLYKVKGE